MEFENLSPVAAWAIRISLFIVGVVLAFVIGRVGSTWARRAMDRTKIDVTVASFLSSAIRWALIVVIFIASLGTLGVKTTTFAAVIGAAGLAIGFALKDTLSSLASGVLILVLRPFKAGDLVTAGGATGTVAEITLFTTMIDTPDNQRIVVPNKSVLNANITNVSHHGRRRADVDVGVAYDADLDETRRILEEAATSVPGRLEEPAPAVVLVNLGASSVDWQVRVWSPKADFAAVKQATIKAVKQALDAASLGIPFPQMDLHFPDGVPEKRAS